MAKNIVIGGRIIIDTAKADASLKQLMKSIKSMENNRGLKIAEDFRKMSPVIDGVDKSLSRMLDKFSKSSADQRIKKINEALKEQGELLRTAFEEAESLNDQLNKATSRKDRKALSEKLGIKEAQVTATMASMQSLDRERSHLKERESREIMAKVGRGIELATMGLGKLLPHEYGKESRRMGYQAQYDSLGNQLLGQALFDPLAYGMNVTGKSNYGKALAAGSREREGFKYNLDAQLIGGIAASAATAYGGGGMYGDVATPAATAAVSGLATGMEILGGQLDYRDPLIQKDAYRAKEAEMQSANVSAVMRSNELLTSLLRDQASHARSRVSTLESLAYMGSGQAQRGMIRNTRAGFEMGFSEEETLGLQGMLSRFGISSQGGQRLATGTFQRFQRAGFGDAGDLASRAIGAMDVIGDQGKVLEAYTKAMEKGVQMGVDKSLAKDIASAAVELARQGSTRRDDLTSQSAQIVNLMKLSGSKLDSAADIRDVTKGISASDTLNAGANNMGVMAQKRIEFDKLERETGVKLTSSMRDRLINSNMKDLSSTDSTFRKQFELLNPGTDFDTWAEKARGSELEAGNVQSARTFNESFRRITGMKGKEREQFLMELGHDSPEARRQYNEALLSVQASSEYGGKTEREQKAFLDARMGLGNWVGPDEETDLKDVTAGTTSRKLADAQIKAESARYEVALDPKVAARFDQAVTAAAKITDALGKGGEFGKGMGDLTAKISELTNMIQSSMGTGSKLPDMIGTSVAKAISKFLVDSKRTIKEATIGTGAETKKLLEAASPFGND